MTTNRLAAIRHVSLACRPGAPAPGSAHGWRRPKRHRVPARTAVRADPEVAKQPTGGERACDSGRVASLASDPANRADSPAAHARVGDYESGVFTGTGFGSVEGQVIAVDINLVPPRANTSGCTIPGEDDFACLDFSGPADIALIQRGTCTFAEKALNAEAAGAEAHLQPGRHAPAGGPDRRHPRRAQRRRHPGRGRLLRRR